MVRAILLAAAIVAAPAAAACPGDVVDGLCRLDSAVDLLRDPVYDPTRAQRLLDFTEVNQSRPVRPLTRWRGGLPPVGSMPALILDPIEGQR